MKFEKLSDGVFELDVKGYVCPHPQIYTKKALTKVHSGEHLHVKFDNPSSGESIASMCDLAGDEIINKIHNDEGFLWDIQKA